MNPLVRTVKKGTIRYYTPNTNLGLDSLIDLRHKLVCIIYPSGMVIHYKNGNEHREDGPALIFSDGGYWWKIDGHYRQDAGFPTISRRDGTVKYWINNKLSDSPPEVSYEFQSNKSRNHS